MRKNKGFVLMAIVAMVALLLASCDNSQKNPIDAIDLHGAPFDRSYIQEDHMSGEYWLVLPRGNQSSDFESRFNNIYGYTYEYVKENGNRREVLRIPYGRDYWIYEVYMRESASTDWWSVDPTIKQKLTVTYLCQENDSMAYCFATKDQKYGIAYIITDSEDIMDGVTEATKNDMDATMIGWVFPFIFDNPTVHFMTDAFIYRVDNEVPPFPGEPNMLNGSYNEEYDNWLDKHSKYPSKISMIGITMEGAQKEPVIREVID